MAFTGDLADVRVPDLLYLITLRSLSGHLRLRRGQEDALLEFRTGRLVRVTSSQAAVPLGELLVQRGLLTPQQLALALQWQASNPEQLPLGTVLLVRRLVSRKALQAVLTAQAEAILYEVLVWAHGTFAFKRHTRPVAAVPLPELNLEHLVLRAIHRADQWQDIRRVYQAAETEEIAIPDQPAGVRVAASRTMRGP